jgi:DNA mismatch repair ATPase MutS
MRCFYQLYKNKQFHETLQYTFGLNGYIDNLSGLRKNVLAKNMNTCSFKEKKCVKFTNAYFPSLVNEKPVKNTYKIDKHLIITGPNAAGKTTLLKATIFNIILSQQVGYGFYKKANIIPYDMIHCYINIPDTSARDSLFQAEAKRCKDILTKIDLDGAVGAGAGGAGAIETNFSNKKQRHFCVFDELYSGTNPYEAISSAYAFLTFLNKYDKVNFVLTTHFLDLCRRLEKERAIHNHHMKIETLNDDFKYTYKLEKGISYIKGGVKVLKDLEYPMEIINNTNATLQELDI